MLPDTAHRVAANTAGYINQRIRERARRAIERAAAGGVPAIDCRLRQLDAEWDVERYLETLAPSLTLVGMGLGLTVNRKFFALPFLVQGLFLQHALQGWCPPVPVLRRMGIRTQAEIDEERAALKSLRGDFRNVGGRTPAQMAVDAQAAARD
jgi:hypothetical protein